MLTYASVRDRVLDQADGWQAGARERGGVGASEIAGAVRYRAHETEVGARRECCGDVFSGRGRTEYVGSANAARAAVDVYIRWGLSEVRLGILDCAEMLRAVGQQAVEPLLLSVDSATRTVRRS